MNTYDEAVQRYRTAVENLPPEHMAQLLRMLNNRPADKASPDYAAFKTFLESAAGAELVASYKEFARLQHSASLAA